MQETVQNTIFSCGLRTASGMSRCLRKFGHVLYRAGHNSIEHDGVEHAGYLAFLSMLALFPFLVFLVTLTGLVGQSGTGVRFVSLLFDTLPPHLVDALRPRVQEILTGPPQGLLTLAILGAIWTSSSAVEGYRTILNRAYHVRNVPRYWVRRLASIGQLLIFSVLILTLILILVVAPVAMQHLPLVTLGPQGIDLSVLMHVLGSVGVRLATFLLLVVMSANVYYILPNTRLSYRSTLPGATLTALGWMGAAGLFSAYLSGVNRINLIYGSLGGVIAALLFFYVTNLIFIYGAELNYLMQQWVGEMRAQSRLRRQALPPDQHQAAADGKAVGDRLAPPQ